MEGGAKPVRHFAFYSASKAALGCAATWLDTQGKKVRVTFVQQFPCGQPWCGNCWRREKAFLKKPTPCRIDEPADSIFVGEVVDFIKEESTPV
jgi:hypothetical protein